MNNLFYDVVLWLVPLAISFYTMTYSLWLWKKDSKRGALGVGFLAVLTALYPGFVLFFVHK